MGYVLSLSTTPTRVDFAISVGRAALPNSLRTPKIREDIKAHEVSTVPLATAITSLNGSLQANMVNAQYNLERRLSSTKNLTQYAETGLGLIYTYSAFAKDKGQQGELIPVLEKHMPIFHRYTINSLSKRHMPNGFY